MHAFVFPGQGAQFAGMGGDLYEQNSHAKDLFEQANELLGFRITDVMFQGKEDELKQTRVTQPAIFLHSVILAGTLGDAYPDMVAGHSLGEFSALVVNRTLSFEDGLALVFKRAMAMQKACEAEPSSMAAIIGLEDEQVENVCREMDEIVVAANYNSPGQVVISGSVAGVDKAMEKLSAVGAKLVVKLAVGGAFHSPLMEPARSELEEAIRATRFNEPVCPVYQNATALASVDPGVIQKNLVAQLTSPVMWTQSVRRMIADGATSFTEVGPGKVLQGLIRKIDREVTVRGA